MKSKVFRKGKAFLELGLKIDPRLEVFDPALVALADNLAATIFKGSKKKSQKVLNVRVLIANLFHSWKLKSSLRIPLSISSYGKERSLGNYGLSYRTTAGLLNYLTTEKYIKIKKGYCLRNKIGKSGGRVTRIWAARRLREDFKVITNGLQATSGPELSLTALKSPIVLKDSKKNIIDPTGDNSPIKTQEIKERELLLSKYKALSSRINISISTKNQRNLNKIIDKIINKKYRGASKNKRQVGITSNKSSGVANSGNQGNSRAIPSTRSKLSRIRSKQKIETAFKLLSDINANQLYCVFNKSSYRKGGRFYGPYYQSIPKSLRKLILIDGEETIELDYRALHISMCYSKIKSDPPVEPYIYKIGSPLRAISKWLLNAAINAPSREVAIKAVLQKISSDRGLTKALKQSTISGATTKRQLEELYDLLSSAHQKVAKKYFGKSAGLSLQYEDSKLTFQILQHFTNKDILVLPIHDSFIIQKKHEKELKDIMLKLFKKRFGFEIGISPL